MPEEVGNQSDSTWNNSFLVLFLAYCLWKVSEFTHPKMESDNGKAANGGQGRPVIFQSCDVSRTRCKLNRTSQAPLPPTSNKKLLKTKEAILVV